MGIRLQKRGKVRLELKSKDKVLETVEETLSMQELSALHSRVCVTMGYTKSRDYQSVHIGAHVEIPIETGYEEGGLNKAAAIADKFLESKEDDVEAYLRGLS